MHLGHVKIREGLIAKLNIGIGWGEDEGLACVYYFLPITMPNGIVQTTSSTALYCHFRADQCFSEEVLQLNLGNSGIVEFPVELTPLRKIAPIN